MLSVDMPACWLPSYTQLSWQEVMCSGSGRYGLDWSHIARDHLRQGSFMQLCITKMVWWEFDQSTGWASNRETVQPAWQHTMCTQQLSCCSTVDFTNHNAWPVASYLLRNACKMRQLIGHALLLHCWSILYILNIFHFNVRWQQW